jgi:hypothetical protein
MHSGDLQDLSGINPAGLARGAKIHVNVAITEDNARVWFASYPPLMAGKK